MRRFNLAIVFTLLATQCLAAGVWSGSTSDLSATVTSTAISYPVFMTAWIDMSENPDADCVLALSDNGTGGSLDALQLNVETSGGTAKATATAAGSASTASTTGLAATGRQFVAAYFASASSRQVKVGTGNWSAAETTTRNVGNFTRVSIGSLHNGSVTAVFDGPITSAAIWTGIDADNVDLAVDQLARGVAPNYVWHLATPYLYQPLETSANQSGKIGATLSATALKFESDIEASYDNEEITYSEYQALLALAGIRKPSTYMTNPVRGPVKWNSGNHVDVRSFRWPDTSSTPGPLPAQRLVTLDTSERIQLAAADDDTWIGATTADRITGAPPVGSESTWASQWVRLRDGGRAIDIDEADGASFTIGSSVAYAAANGKVDDTGTVPIGIVIDSDSDVATVLPY